MALAWERFTPPSGWTRIGAEWRGCCPVTGEGRTRAWALPGRGVLGCRHCGDGAGRLAGADFAAHAAALGVLADPWRPPPRPRTVAPARAPRQTWPTWRRLSRTCGAARPHWPTRPARRTCSNGSDGRRPGRPRCAGSPRMPSRTCDPRPPDGAAGCIVYELRARDRTAGLQVEAVAADGGAIRTR